MKILLALDGSAFTEKMIAYVTYHPELFGAANHYTGLTVRAQVSGRVKSMVGSDTVQDYHSDEAEEVLAPARSAMAKAGLQLETLFKLGPLGETIAEAAETGGFDLIVMGSHGHGSLANLVMGSVATEVLKASKVPVLLVR
jgi:nucleotide-binding universal stress UspA family protein